MARSRFLFFYFPLLFLFVFQESHSQTTWTDSEVVLEPFRLTGGRQSNKWDVCSAFCEKHFLVWVDDREDVNLEGGHPRIYGGLIDEPATQLISSDKTASFESKPAIDAGKSTFVVVWLQVDSERLKIFGRIFSKDGKPLTDNFIVDELTTSYEVGTLDLEVNANGEFIVLWNTRQKDSDSKYRPWFRIFDSNGTAQTTPQAIQLHRPVADCPDLCAVATNESDFIVNWIENADSTGFILNQMISLDGTVLVPLSKVSSDTLVWRTSLDAEKTKQSEWIICATGTEIETKKDKLEGYYITPTTTTQVLNEYNASDLAGYFYGVSEWNNVSVGLNYDGQWMCAAKVFGTDEGKEGICIYEGNENSRELMVFVDDFSFLGIEEDEKQYSVIPKLSYDLFCFSISGKDIFDYGFSRSYYFQEPGSWAFMHFPFKRIGGYYSSQPNVASAGDNSGAYITWREVGDNESNIWVKYFTPSQKISSSFSVSTVQAKSILDPINWTTV